MAGIGVDRADNRVGESLGEKDLLKVSATWLFLPGLYKI